MLTVVRSNAWLAQVGDPGATRTVYATVVVFMLIGLGLAALAVVLFRRTRPEPELLAPLEEMQTRRWRQQGPADQRRTLDESRPPGARPLKREASIPNRDAEFDDAPVLRGFDDLDPSVDATSSHDAGEDDTQPGIAAPTTQDTERLDESDDSDGPDEADEITSEHALVSAASPDAEMAALSDTDEPVMPGEGLLRRRREPG